MVWDQILIWSAIISPILIHLEVTGQTTLFVYKFGVFFVSNCYRRRIASKSVAKWFYKSKNVCDQDSTHFLKLMPAKIGWAGLMSTAKFLTVFAIYWTFPFVMIIEHILELNLVIARAWNDSIKTRQLVPEIPINLVCPASHN